MGGHVIFSHYQYFDELLNTAYGDGGQRRARSTGAARALLCCRASAGLFGPLHAHCRLAWAPIVRAPGCVGRDAAVKLQQLVAG